MTRMIWKSFEHTIEPGSEDARLLEQIDPKRLPGHVAVIMDGNGRWAGARALPRIEGHRAGTESVRQIIETSARLGLHCLTLYAFSVENWRRPKAEVDDLMRLLRKYIRSDLPTLMKHNIRFQAIGRIQDMSLQTRRLIRHAEKSTAANSGLRLNVALNYGGRTELADAARRIATEAVAGTLDPAGIDPDTISSRLYTAGLPDPDLLIRTSGEYRVSNFLLWQIAYTEIHVTPVLWPDFRQGHLFQAILDFQGRVRRFGGL